LAKSERSGADPILVIGLGRFGTSVALSLVRLGHEVLAVDESAEIVKRYADDFTHVVAADSTDTEALKQIGADQFSRAVVGIGTDIEASVLTVLGLAELGVAEIWAKAISAKHAKILTSVGATNVVRPESAMGERVAHLVTGTMSDFMEFDDDFAIARTRTPKVAAGKTLHEAALRTKYGVTVVGVKARGAEFVYAQPETVVGAGDELIIAGTTAEVDAFCASR
jgi:trk system potassium uptake protein TrkA